MSLLGLIGIYAWAGVSSLFFTLGLNFACTAFHLLCVDCNRVFKFWS